MKKNAPTDLCTLVIFFGKKLCPAPYEKRNVQLPNFNRF